ncbi:hypothetical protein AgCh_038152 [Apium graveolens]
MKFFRNASELVGQYHEKNKPCANIAIGLDYDVMNDKKKTVGDKEKTKKTKNAPTFLKEVNTPIFKACEVKFSEEELIIKQEIADEDKEKKSKESTQSSNTEEKLMVKQSSKIPFKETKTEDARKKKKNKNGKIGINKSNNFAYVADAPRKKCEKFGSINHLNHLCKKVVSKPTEGACKYNEADLNDLYSFCDKFDYIPCNFKVMKKESQDLAVRTSSGSDVPSKFELTDKFTIRNDLNMSLNKYESIKIPILKKTEYPTWKVKMLIYLEATDPDYLDEKTEWTPEEKIAVLKDAKISDPAQQSVFGGKAKERERKSNKGKSVALKVNDKASKEKSVGVVRKKNHLPESDTDDSSSNPDDDTDSKTDENMTDSDVMQMAALLVKGFRRMRFRKSRNNRSFRKKFTGGEKKSTGRKDGKDSKAGKVVRTKIKCYNCEPGHFASEYKKTKNDKEKSKGLITSSKNWMDSSDSEDENTCYALMASLDDPAASEPKVQILFFSFDTENIFELKSILKSFHGSFKNKTLENDRLITEIKTLKSRNDQLESDLIHQIDLKKECKKVHEIISKKNWKECLVYKDGVKDVDTENKITLKNPVKFISVEADEPKSTFEKGSTSVSQEKQVSDKTQRKKSKETIKNGKQGISKDSNYKVVPNVPRKTCFNCGNTNHLAINCRRNKKRKTAIPESDVRVDVEKKAGPDVSYGDGNVGHTLGYGN